MFAGVYWSARQETRSALAGRLARYLGALAGCDRALSQWFHKGRSRRAASTPVSVQPATLAELLRVNRRDATGEEMPEVGLSLGIWNGKNASLTGTLGAYYPRIQNAVVLALEDPQALGRAVWQQVLAAAIMAFDPDHGVVTSTEALTRAGAEHPWQAGWLTYRRGGTIVWDRRGP